MIPFHDAASIFPLLEGEEFESLKADILTRGLQEPIVLYEGKILDGRNRYRACLAVSVQPRFEQYRGDDPRAYVWSLNFERRHLTREQRAALAVRLREEGESIRRIAEMTGQDKNTVMKQVSEVQTPSV